MLVSPLSLTSHAGAVIAISTRRGGGAGFKKIYRRRVSSFRC